MGRTARPDHVAAGLAFLQQLGDDDCNAAARVSRSTFRLPIRSGALLASRSCRSFTAQDLSTIDLPMRRRRAARAVAGSGVGRARRTGVGRRSPRALPQSALRRLRRRTCGRAHREKNLGARAVTAVPLSAPARGEVSALILAAGKATRLGQPKAFLEYAGKTLLERVVEQAANFADEILVGLPREDLGRVPPSIRARSVTVVAGGETLQGTVEALLAPATRPLVLLHEVARPLTPASLFADVLREAQASGAAAPCLPVSTRDSLALDDGGFLGAALPRTQVVWIQTPQAYRWVWLADALRRAKRPDPTARVLRSSAAAGCRLSSAPSARQS